MSEQNERMGDMSIIEYIAKNHNLCKEIIKKRFEIIGNYDVATFSDEANRIAEKLTLGEYISLKDELKLIWLQNYLSAPESFNDESCVLFKEKDAEITKLKRYTSRQRKAMEALWGVIKGYSYSPALSVIHACVQNSDTLNDFINAMAEVNDD